MKPMVRYLVSSLAVVSALVAVPAVANADPLHDGRGAYGEHDRDRHERERIERERIEREQRIRWERERAERARIEHARECRVAWERGATPWQLWTMGCYVR